MRNADIMLMSFASDERTGTFGGAGLSSGSGGGGLGFSAEVKSIFGIGGDGSGG